MERIADDGTAQPALRAEDIYKGLLNTSRTTFFALRKSGKFPTPSFYLGANSPRWLLSDVRKAIAALQQNCASRGG